MTFSYKDSATDQTRFSTIPAEEFIRRFLQNVRVASARRLDTPKTLSSRRAEATHSTQAKYSLNLTGRRLPDKQSNGGIVIL